MMYYVSVSPDVLNVADVEINYLDAAGVKQKEILTDTTWRKPLTTNTLPLTEGVWAKLTPKVNNAACKLIAWLMGYYPAKYCKKW